MTRQVVISREVTTDNATLDKGYLMVGNNGEFILARTPEDKFIFVRVNAGKVSKAINTYDTLKEALEDKIENGYEVFEYKTAEELYDLLH